MRSLEPIRSSQETDGPRLLPEESQVLALSATGLGTEAVAVRLGLSCGVVRNLIASAALKLGARSKLEAVVIALSRGEIELPP